MSRKKFDRKKSGELSIAFLQYIGSGSPLSKVDSLPVTRVGSGIFHPDIAADGAERKRLSLNFHFAREVQCLSKKGTKEGIDLFSHLARPAEDRGTRFFLRLLSAFPR